MFVNFHVIYYVHLSRFLPNHLTKFDIQRNCKKTKFSIFPNNFMLTAGKIRKFFQSALKEADIVQRQERQINRFFRALWNCESKYFTSFHPYVFFACTITS